MSGELVPGLERSEDFEVDAGLLTDVGGTIGSEVLSTPGMIAMMERNAVKLAYESLPEGKATVGFEVLREARRSGGPRRPLHGVCEARGNRRRAQVALRGRGAGRGPNRRGGDPRAPSGGRSPLLELSAFDLSLIHI